MRPSDYLFDSLAEEYDEHFTVLHRRAYDDLAWEIVAAGLPKPPAQLLDVGCGVGRWAERLVNSGYSMTGIEPSPCMAAAFRARAVPLGATLHECRLEEVELDPKSLDGAFAMGSLQYSDDIRASIARVAGWLRPGAPLFVLADSAVALGLELTARGDVEQAVERLESRKGRWTQHGMTCDHHLFDRKTLQEAFECAGLRHVGCYGLLVGSSALGRDGVTAALESDYEQQLAQERRLSRVEALADCGKQLLVVGRR